MQMKMNKVGARHHAKLPLAAAAVQVRDIHTVFTGSIFTAT